MSKNSKKSSDPGEVQVFELTMDNDEDQDELNRRLRKPGEPDYCPPAKPVGPDNSPPTAAQREAATEPRKAEPPR